MSSNDDAREKALALLRAGALGSAMEVQLKTAEAVLVRDPTGKTMALPNLYLEVLAKRGQSL